MTISITERTWKQAIRSLMVDLPWGTFRYWSVTDMAANSREFPDLTVDQRDCVRHAIACMALYGVSNCTKAQAQRLLSGEQVKGQVADWEYTQKAKAAWPEVAKSAA